MMYSKIICICLLGAAQASRLRQSGGFKPDKGRPAGPAQPYQGGGFNPPADDALDSGSFFPERGVQIEMLESENGALLDPEISCKTIARRFVTELKSYGYDASKLKDRIMRKKYVSKRDKPMVDLQLRIRDICDVISHHSLAGWHFKEIEERAFDMVNNEFGCYRFVLGYQKPVENLFGNDLRLRITSNFNGVLKELFSQENESYTLDLEKCKLIDSGNGIFIDEKRRRMYDEKRYQDLSIIGDAQKALLKSLKRIKEADLTEQLRRVGDINMNDKKFQGDNEDKRGMAFDDTPDLPSGSDPYADIGKILMSKEETPLYLENAKRKEKVDRYTSL